MKVPLQSADESKVGNLSCHSERSAAESKNPAALPNIFATGFLDFARNDRKIDP